MFRNLKINLKRILNKERYFSKAFWGSIFMAIALWTYTSLNMEYITFVKVPLFVKLPENKSLENNIPKDISLEVKGNGWHLFNLIFFNNAKRCNIDLSSSNFTSNTIQINRSTMLKSIEYLNAQTSDVLPETINLQTGIVANAKVKVNPVVYLKTRDNYVRIGQINVNPEFIYIKGNEKIIKNIQQWSTKPIILNDIFEPVNISSFLSDSLKGMVRLSTNNVRVSFDIEAISEVEINDLEPEVIGGKKPENLTISPKFFTTVIRGGINQIENLNIEKVSLSLNYKDIITDSSGLFTPKVKIPPGYELVKLDPPFATISYKAIPSLK